MSARTSTVPTATRRESASLLRQPRRTLTASPQVASPTLFLDAQLLHATTPSLSPSCCSTVPSKVVVDLSTTVVISDYSQLYGIPVTSFHPTYSTLADGSLLAPPFLNDLKNAYVNLIFSGAMIMLFMRNVVLAVDYIWRGTIKKKRLFYILLVSQLVGLIAQILPLTAYFTRVADCVIIVPLSAIATFTSFGLLITGILGVKAYKCLDNSRLVLIALFLFQTSSMAIEALDLVTVRGERMLSGSCGVASRKGHVPSLVLIRLFETLFICCCFLYAVWKSRGLPAVRGRISIQLSLIDIPEAAAEEIGQEHRPEISPAPRGWWDYVPKGDQTAEQTAPTTPAHGFFTRFRRKFDIRNRDRKLLPDTSPPHQQKSSVPEKKHTTQPRQPSTVRISESGGTPVLLRRPPDGPPRAASPVPSSMSRLSRLMPRMVLFREVMQDELNYTTFIAVTFVAVAILAVIGVNSKNDLAVTGSTILNWASISMMAMHSFSRVIRRHENEALLQHPLTWAQSARRDFITTEHSRRHGNLRGLRPPASVASLNPNRQIRQSTAGQNSPADDGGNNPFEDPDQEDQRTHAALSWYSERYGRSIGTISETGRPSPFPSIVSFARAPPTNGPATSLSPSIRDLPLVSGRNTPVPESHDASIAPKLLGNASAPKYGLYVNGRTP